MRPNLILNYLRKVRSYPYEGEERYRTLMKDLRLSEIENEIKLLPENTLLCKNVTHFTRKEVEKDVDTHWKYNKRN